MYQTYINHLDNTASYFMRRNRTSWALATAKKHLRDVIRKKISNEGFEDVAFFHLIPI